LAAGIKFESQAPFRRFFSDLGSSTPAGPQGSGRERQLAHYMMLKSFAALGLWQDAAAWLHRKARLGGQ